MGTPSISRYMLSFMLLILFCASSVNAAKIVQLRITGPIGPATADYMERTITAAQNADLIVVLLDTPGGLDEATRAIIQKFLNSKVPIVTYVSPNGARAASAGTFLLYASTLAAMAPGTHLGAASPVTIDDGLSSAHKQSPVMEKKIRSDALATIRSLAQLRGRDPVFAQQAVSDATSITASEALKAGAINYIATDIRDLLSQLNNVTVLQNNQKITLNTASPSIEVVNPDWRTEFLSVITNPTVAYFLILLGIYGILFELMSPGFVFPGVIGGVSILVALYALQLLPINYAGLGLIILGIIFIVAEGFTPSYGSLGVGGTMAFVLGSIMLMNTDNAAYHIAWLAIWAMAVVNFGIFIVLLGMVIKSKQQTVKNGLVMLVGAQGRTLSEVNPRGQAVIRGEIWSVCAKKPIAANQQVKVVKTLGLLLEIDIDEGS